MDKLHLERFISKYNLGGECEAVVLKSNKGRLSVRAISKTNDMLVELSLDNTDFPDGEFGIRDTRKLKSILGVLGNNISISAVTTNGSVTGVSFSDSNTESIYALADTSIYPKVPDVDTLPNTAFSIKLNDRFVQTYIRAKSALVDAPTVEILRDKKTGNAIAVLGGGNINTDRISIKLDLVEGDSVPETFSGIKYSALFLREALVANKEVSDAKMQIKIDAPSIIEISVDDFNATYYLVNQS